MSNFEINYDYDRELVDAVKKVIEIGQRKGYDNILEKAKWKEAILGDILGHTVFTKSTGDVKGADAVSTDGTPYEYKTSQLKTKETDRFLGAVVDGEKTCSKSLTYNNGYSRENVDEYREIGHIHGVFSELGEPLAITHVKTDHVVDSLLVRVEKTENGTAEYKSTNGNSVSVHYEDGKVREGEGEVLYVNDTRK